MHPVLYEIWDFPLRTYGVMLALGFLAAFIFARLQAKRADIDPNIIPDLLIWIFAGGILGARLLYVVIHSEEFSNLMDILAIWKGGQVYYGGFAGAVIAGYIFARRRKLKVLDLADLAMPAAMLGQAIGRWGCFMAGCCYGKVADPDFPLGVAFPKIEKSLIPEQCQNADLAHPTCYLHPSQLYMSANAVILWLVLWFLLRKRRHRGLVTGATLVLYATSRSILEYWRGDAAERVETLGLSTSQWVSVPVLLFGIYLLMTLRKRPVPTKIEEGEKK
jgi:phosphatidylglycerol:prolipoprotein diacylglycerol transferase